MYAHMEGFFLIIYNCTKCIHIAISETDTIHILYFHRGDDIGYITYGPVAEYMTQNSGKYKWQVTIHDEQDKYATGETDIIVFENVPPPGKYAFATLSLLQI